MNIAIRACLLAALTLPLANCVTSSTNSSTRNMTQEQFVQREAARNRETTEQMKVQGNIRAVFSEAALAKLITDARTKEERAEAATFIRSRGLSTNSRTVVSAFKALTPNQRAAYVTEHPATFASLQQQYAASQGSGASQRSATSVSTGTVVASASGGGGPD
ncbi:hypothetical protein ACK8OR_01380 [Jannaschia sp. KMU-145]|uniref:hypothetical protein n=1 Tax=Jannaschia halovivens TaxID=3388667 RepID=UPI00396B2DCF